MNNGKSFSEKFFLNCNWNLITMSIFWGRGLRKFEEMVQKSLLGNIICEGRRLLKRNAFMNLFSNLKFSGYL